METLGPFDAIVATVEQVKFGPCLADKLMGQVNLARAGLRHVAEGGSFTLTSGRLARYPVPGGSAITLVDAGLEAFAKSAALEMPRGARINAVSPPRVSEALSKGLPAAKAAKAFVESVEGTRNGETLDTRELAQDAISLARAVSRVAHPAIHASETGVSTLETAVSGSETGVSTLEAAVSGSETGVAALETAVSGSGTGVSTLETAVSGSETGVSTLETAVSGSETGVSTLETAVSGSETGVAALETAVSGSGTGVSTLEAAVSGSETGVAALETAVSGSGAGVSALKTAVSASQIGVSAVGTAVRAPQIGVSAVGTAVRAAQIGVSVVGTVVRAAQIGVSVVGTAVRAARGAGAAPGYATGAAPDRDPAVRIPGYIIPAVVDEAEDASPPLRRRVAALVSVAAHPFVLIPALLAVVTARSLPAREAAAVVALVVAGSMLPVLGILVRRVRSRCLVITPSETASGSTTLDMTKAPFRLQAIVFRLDLRKSSAYSWDVADWSLT